MILTVLFNKLKSLVLVFVNLFRRALCCFRRRRVSTCDVVPLTHVVSNSDSRLESQNWEDWDDGTFKEPKTVQDHIEIYRKRKVQTVNESPENEEAEDANLFEDMTPNITKQTKLYIKPQGEERSKKNVNRLNFFEDFVQAVPTAELREWEDTSGWDGESLETDAQRVLREKKRQDRERRTWEQHQKRLEKNSNRSLGSKLSA